MEKTLRILFVFMLSVQIAWGGDLKTRQIDVRNFDKIDVSNSLDVQLIADGREGVAVTCDERLLPAIKVNRQGETLKIGLDWRKIKEITGHSRLRNISINKDRVKINGMVFNGGISITVHLKHVSQLQASSSADIHWKGNLPTHDLEIRCSSSADIFWEGLLDIDEIDISCSSSGEVRGNLKTRELEVDLSSSSDYVGNIETEKIEAEISSSADMQGTLSTRDAIFEVSSSADLRMEIEAVNAHFDISSSADAKIKGVIDFLSVEASSSSTFLGKAIIYKKAEVEANSSADIYLSKSGEVIDHTPKRSGVFIE